MASIYKRKYRKLINGKLVKKQSKCWHIKYRADGIECRVKGYISKPATQLLAAKLESGLIKKEQKPSWLLAKTEGLVSEHLKDFNQYLIDKGDTPDYVRLTYNRIVAILDGCNFSDIQAHKPCLFKDTKCLARLIGETQPHAMLWNLRIIFYTQCI